MTATRSRLKANAVLENYKSHGGRVVGTDSVPRTPDRPAEHFIAVVLAGQIFSRGPLPVLNWWTASDTRLFIRIAFTARNSATK